MWMIVFQSTKKLCNNYVPIIHFWRRMIKWGKSVSRSLGAIMCSLIYILFGYHYICFALCVFYSSNPLACVPYFRPVEAMVPSQNKTLKYPNNFHNHVQIRSDVKPWQSQDANLQQCITAIIIKLIWPFSHYNETSYNKICILL